LKSSHPNRDHPETMRRDGEIFNLEKHSGRNSSTEREGRWGEREDGIQKKFIPRSGGGLGWEGAFKIKNNFLDTHISKKGHSELPGRRQKG